MADGGAGGAAVRGDGATLLRRARLARRWSPKGLAARLVKAYAEDPRWQGKQVPNITPHMVRSWEAGPVDGHRPQARHREKLCLLFGMSEEALGLDKASWPYPRPRHEGDAYKQLENGQDPQSVYAAEDAGHGNGRPPGGATPIQEGLTVQRQRFLRLCVTLGVAGAADLALPGGLPVDRFGVLASGPARSREGTSPPRAEVGMLADHQAVTDELCTFGKNVAVPPLDLIVPLRAQLDVLVGILATRRQPETERRVYAQIAQINDSLARVAFALDVPGLAREYFAEAAGAAALSQRPGLSAEVLSGSVWTMLEATSPHGLRTVAKADRAGVRRRSRQVINLLADVRKFATQGEGVGPWSLARIHMFEADAHAALGDLAAAERNIELAERVIERADPGDRRSPLDFFDAARFTFFKGTAYLRLGRYGLAQAILRESERLYPPHLTVALAQIRLKQALIEARQGRLDAAVETASPACDLSPALNCTTVRWRARDLRVALAGQLDTPEVQQLDGRLAQLAA